MDQFKLRRLYGKWTTLLEGDDEELYDDDITRGEYREYLGKAFIEAQAMITNSAIKSKTMSAAKMLTTSKEPSPYFSLPSQSFSLESSSSESEDIDWENEDIDWVNFLDRSSSSGSTCMENESEVKAIDQRLLDTTESTSGFDITIDKFDQANVPSQELLVADVDPYTLFSCDGLFERNKMNSELIEKLTAKWTVELLDQYPDKDSKGLISNLAHAKQRMIDLIENEGDNINENKGNNNNGRKRGDPLERWINMKDKSVRGMFEVASNYVKKLNKQATFVDEKRHKEHGKSHYFLLAYDELVQQPKIRDKPGKRK